MAKSVISVTFAANAIAEAHEPVVPSGENGQEGRCLPGSPSVDAGISWSQSAALGSATLLLTEACVSMPVGGHTAASTLSGMEIPKVRRAIQPAVFRTALRILPMLTHGCGALKCFKVRVLVRTSTKVRLLRLRRARLLRRRLARPDHTYDQPDYQRKNRERYNRANQHSPAAPPAHGQPPRKGISWGRSQVCGHRSYAGASFAPIAPHANNSRSFRPSRAPRSFFHGGLTRGNKA